MQEDFESITQYDKSFDDLFTNINHKGFACGFFSILTVGNFMAFANRSKLSHENIIKKTIEYCANKKINHGLNFDELFDIFCNLNKKNIMSTSVELIKNNILSYEHIFENKENKPFGVIFLKNEKYFAVLYDKQYYYIRDCHCNLQKTIKTFDELKIYLKNTYQFENDIDLLGDEYINYSSIEYVRVFDKFKCNIKYEVLSFVEKTEYDLDVIKNMDKEKTKKLFTELQNLDFNQYENQDKIYTDDDTICF